MFDRVGNRIDISGHTQTVSGGKDAWRLSLRRTEAVASDLKRIGAERNISVLGLGQSRYKHLWPTFSVARRNGLARRVDIVIYPTKEEP